MAKAKEDKMSFYEAVQYTKEQALKAKQKTEQNIQSVIKYSIEEKAKRQAK